MAFSVAPTEQEFAQLLIGPQEKSKLILSMDYGTKTLSMSWRFVRPGDNMGTDVVRAVIFTLRQAWAQQKVAWRGEDFLWGDEVDWAVAQGEIDELAVVELWKLLLYKDLSDSAMAKDVKRALGKHTLEQLLECHLRAVMEFAMANIKRQAGIPFSVAQLEEAEVQLLLSVPQMWTPPAAFKMQTAAKAAGIPVVELVYEPQCAAAYFTHNVGQLLPEQLFPGNILLIADVGGGTGDFVSYKVTTPCVSGASVGLELAGRAIGSLCGSEFVNERFRDHERSNPQQLQERCEALGISEALCLKRASAQFEKAKMEFVDPTHLTDFYLAVRPNVKSGKKAVNFELSSAEIGSFFDPVIDEVIECIKAQLTIEDTVLIMPGGFGRSEYVMKRVGAAFAGYGNVEFKGQSLANTGSLEPVACGALMRYKSIKTRGFDKDNFFGLAQTEPFDKNIHKDAMYTAGDIMASGKKCGTDNHWRDWAVIKNNHVNETSSAARQGVVHMRWVPIASTNATAGEPVVNSTIQLNHVKLSQDGILTQVYWTNKPDLRKNDAMTDEGEEDSDLKRGIEEMGTALAMMLPNLRAEGYEEYDGPRLGKHFRVFTRLQVRCSPPNVNIVWQRAGPGWELFEESNIAEEDVRWIDDINVDFIEKEHNPFPRNTTS